jgi:hypothetical protein
MRKRAEKSDAINQISRNENALLKAFLALSLKYFLGNSSDIAKNAITARAIKLVKPPRSKPREYPIESKSLLTKLPDRSTAASFRMVLMMLILYHV